MTPHGRLLDPLSWNPHPPSLPVSNQPLSLQILDKGGHQYHELGTTFPPSPTAETLQHQSHRYTNDNYPSQPSQPKPHPLHQYPSPYTPFYWPYSSFEQSHSSSIDSSGPNKFAESFPAGTEHQENIVNGNSHQEESSGVFSILEPFVPLESFLAESQQTTFGFEQSYSPNLSGLNLNAPAEPFFASPENQENTISGNSYQEQPNGGFSATRSQFVDPGPPVPYWGSFLPENHQPTFGLDQEQSQYSYANYANNVLAISPWLPFTTHQGSATNDELPQDKSSNTSEPIDPQPLNNPSRSSVLQTPENVTHGSGSTPSQNFRCNKCLRPLAGPHKCSYQKRTLTIRCHGNDDKCLQEFTKRSDFNRHWNNAHVDGELFKCLVPGCKRGKKGFKRKDNLTQHRRLCHGEIIEKNPIRYGGGNARGSGSAEVEPVEG